MCRRITGALFLWFFSWNSGIAGEINYHHFKLANGLEVVVVENHRAPVVLHKLYFKVGSLDDPRGKSGLAHFLEHMMFKGGPETPPDQLNTLLHRIGGLHNATTTPSITDYYEVVHKNYLDQVMAIEAQRIHKMYFDEKDVASEIQVVLEERRMRVANDPVHELVEAMRASSTWNHTSRLPAIGWEHEIKSYTSEDVRRFHDTWYAPNNAVLLLAGDITVEEAKKMVEQRYAPLASREVARRDHLIEPQKQNFQQRLIHTTPNVASPMLIELYQAPSLVEGFNPEIGHQILSTQLLIQCLVGGRGAQLWKKLVEERKIATSIHISYSVDLAPGVLAIVAEPTAKHSISQLEKAIHEEIHQILRLGLRQQDLDQAKQRALVTRDYTKDNLIEAADELVDDYALGVPLEVTNSWPERLQKLDLDSVNKALQKVLSNAPFMVGELHPASPKEPQ